MPGEEPISNAMPEKTEPTAVQNQEEKPVTPTAPQEPEQKPERMYSKQEVIEMMKKRVNRSHQAFFNRYKVKDLAELDSVFNKISEYEKQIADLGVTNAGLLKNNAYLKNNINPNKVDDIEAYFKGKGIEFNEQALINEIATHPEWLKVAIKEVPQTTIKTLSPERSHNVVETEDEKMSRVFGI